MKKRNKKTLIAVAVVFLLGLVFATRNIGEEKQTEFRPSGVADVMVGDIPERLTSSQLQTDFTKSSIDLEKVLSGGPGKDGIPAITNPEFESIEKSTVEQSTQVIAVKNEGEVKLYPYSILVWHEIVNDTVGSKPLAITFCPLCGSAVVFEREIDDEVVQFGVSGLLYESNMIMYSRGNDESLYSQSLGKAVIGSKTGERLERYPLELLSFADAGDKYPGAVVMSMDTGFPRDYNANPYSGYEDTEDLLFEVSNKDERFPAKEVFYIVPIEGMSVAVQLNKSDGDYPVPDSNIIVSVDKGSITAWWGDAEIPGYYEMWFSWATHNQSSGIVL